MTATPADMHSYNTPPPRKSHESQHNEQEPRPDWVDALTKRIQFILLIISLISVISSITLSYASATYAIDQKADQKELQEVKMALDQVRAGQESIASKQSEMNERLRSLICDALKASERTCNLVR